MASTFGSIGDIISISLVLKDLVNAIDDSRGSTTEYRELIRELQDLDRTLVEIDLLLRRFQTTTELQTVYQAVSQATQNCRHCIESFTKTIKKYDAGLGENRSKNVLRNTVRKVQWLSEKADLARFRTELNVHSSSINMLLATVNVHLLKTNHDKRNIQDNVMSEIRDHLKDDNNLVSISNLVVTKITDMLKLSWFKQLGSEMKSLIEKIFAINVATYRAVIAIQTRLPGHLERTLIQEPFILEDAIGRIAPVHLQFINSWEAFDYVLELRFRNIQGYSKVKNKEYVLQEHATRHEIKRDRSWEAAFLPGQRIDMALIFKNGGQNYFNLSTCPRCQTDSPGLLDSDIKCTGCGMWYRRITEYEDINPKPIVIPSAVRRPDARFGQNGFELIKFGPPVPITHSADSKKRKLSELDACEANDMMCFKRVRVISKTNRINHTQGLFTFQTTATGDLSLDSRARQQASEQFLRKLFEKTAALHGMNHSDTISSLNNLAWCLRNQREFDKAETLFRAGFDARKENLITDDPEALLAMMSNLRVVLIDQSKYLEADELLQQVKAMFSSNLNISGVAGLLNRLKTHRVFYDSTKDSLEMIQINTKLNATDDRLGKIVDRSEARAPTPGPQIQLHTHSNEKILRKEPSDTKLAANLSTDFRSNPFELVPTISSATLASFEGQKSQSKQGKSSRRESSHTNILQHLIPFPSEPENFGFLYRIDALETTYDKIPPRYLNFDGKKCNDLARIWFPPIRASQFKRRRGSIYRWTDETESKKLEDNQCPKNLWQVEVASVFFQARQNNFLAVFEDCTQCDIADQLFGWSQIGFHHSRGFMSEVDLEGDHELLAAPADHNSWMPQIIPEVYNYDTKNPSAIFKGQPGGLCGKLSLLIAMAAFSAPVAQAESTVSKCFVSRNWKPHSFETGIGRYQERGVVVTIYLDPEAKGVTASHIRAFEGGEYGPIFAP